MEQYVLRSRYLQRIKPFVDKPVIKTLIGLRRSGKSTLLQMIRQELLQSVPDTRIFFLNFESRAGMDITDVQQFIEMVHSFGSKAKGKIYLLLDEIQLLPGWEQAVNSFRVDLDCDIYITGSNAELLSGKLSTLLAGRYVEFQVYPLTFSEFCLMHEKEEYTVDQLFEFYVTMGGMPFLRHLNFSRDESLKYLDDVFNTIVVKDVVQAGNIRDVDFFTRLMRFMLENIGETFSARSISNYLKSEQRRIAVDTVLNYLHFAENAFLLERLPRYDLIGKKLLTVDEKFYVADHGFREAAGFSNTAHIERVLENIVAIELLSRGYELKVGRIDKREVDFLVEKGSTRLYIQVAYLLADADTIDREFSPLHDIPDNLPKLVLSLDTFDRGHDGIRHMNLKEFLMLPELSFLN